MEVLQLSSLASWGVDFGDPADAPLWCALYDTLGENGILSCGATINGNQNVDIIGDLPTACPSEYLITVTNTDITDNKVVNAGYGLETIDLGAPGQGAYTTQSGNGYGGFGGEPVESRSARTHLCRSKLLLESTPHTCRLLRRRLLRHHRLRHHHRRGRRARRLRRLHRRRRRLGRHLGRRTLVGRVKVGVR